MKQPKTYWKGLEQLKSDPQFEERSKKEFPEYLPINESEGEPTRRDFLKYMGFGLAAVTVAACEAPVRKAIPYVKKPNNLDPSVPNYYASTYVSGSDYANVVVKTREGRPIKVEGNKMSSTSGGGTNPQIEASVLSLYDKERLQNPKIDGADATWADVDKAVTTALSAASGTVYLVTNSVASPSTIKAIDELKAQYPSVKQVAYDQYSQSALLDAHGETFGKRAMPSYDYSKCKTIVSFEADFLGIWPNNTLNNKQFAASRKLGDDKKEMSRLYAFESILSLTGANADYRTMLKPSQQGLYVANLYNKIASKLGAASLSVSKVADDVNLTKAANDLLKSKGSSIVVSGTNDPNVQKIVVAINELLGNYGSTLDIAKHQNVRSGDDKAFAEFVSDIKAGSAAGVIFYNCNPVYDHANGADIKEGLAKIGFSVSTSDRNDETSSLTKIVAPDSHYLESWNDFELVPGELSLSQPTISNIFNTRQAQESFLTWSGNSSSYYDFIKTNWEAEVFGNVEGDFYDFEAFFDKCLHDGVLQVASVDETLTADLSTIADAAAGISTAYSDNSSEMELVLYMSNSVGNGIQANNPWLQELPDPITKVTWENYIIVSPKHAEELNIEIDDMNTQVGTITVGGETFTLPMVIQPGLKYGTVGIALGYGRTAAGKVANGVGYNAYPLLSSNNGYTQYTVSGVSVSNTNESYALAHTQTAHTYMGRETIIQESVLSEYQKDPQAGRQFPKIATKDGMKKPYAISLWKGHEYANHHWGLVVDLNSCTGCATCSVSCQTENNIPVVGKDQVIRRRDMHWIRIDRYYSSQAPEDAGIGDKRWEKATENPEVTFQPMMCQHCNNAPCETVCPVAATTHSTEGLNQMTYNRCVGTRYCANNCPYKVRRFNWFKFHDNDKFPDNLSQNNDLGKMVLNPDVTVRSRGVIEKCSFCVQRIQAGKLEAKKEGRRIADGEVTTACASSCPSDALVFGDMKDPNSEISKLLKIQKSGKGVESQEPRAYHVLEEVGVMPNVWYLTKIRNKDKVETKGAGTEAHS
ncbi:MAG: TAT-variant-translocated molybdopterin oxidoreductase [Cyclobacteriaceae bacterium]